ncbi:sensor histidine kinase [Nitratifractor sp.]
MSAERRTFWLFVVTYFLSTLLLAGVLLYQDYSMRKEHLLERTAQKMQEELRNFLRSHVGKGWRMGVEDLERVSLPLAIVVDGKMRASNILEFRSAAIPTRPFWLHGEWLYASVTEQKRWGEVRLITRHKIDKALTRLRVQVGWTAAAALLFILAIAMVLGRMFLGPIRRLLRRQEAFIAETTHEINTPIAILLSNLEMMELLRPELKECEELARIRSSADRIHRLYKDLSLVRLEHEMPKHLETFSLDTLLRERLDAFRTLLAQKEISLRERLAPKEIHADREEWMRLIDNLLSNAAKYTPSGGIVTVTLEGDCLQVCNTGRLDTSRPILRPFVRGSHHAEGGFGLGLALVEKVCRRHGVRFKIHEKSGVVCAQIDGI